MTRQEFDILAKKYIAGDCTPEEAALVEEWTALHYKRHSEHPFYKMRQEAMRHEDRIWEKIRVEAGIEQSKTKPRWRSSLWLGVAACVMIIMLGSRYFSGEDIPNEISNTPPSGIESRNATVFQQRIILPDSSIVVLEPGASIVANEDYGKSTRMVFLTGEAFFEVQSNPQIPFLVYIGELITEVLGTSFRIKPEDDNKTIEVTVMTGKVSIYTERNHHLKKRNGVIINPNQKVVFNTESKMVRQDLVDIPEMIVPPVQGASFLFDDTPIEKVLALMQKTYGVEIVIGNIALKQCVFTGDLNGLGLYEQLDHICNALSASYEVRGIDVFISGNGCG